MSGPADGKPSAKTSAAISAYEKAHGLPVTGVATDELLRQHPCSAPRCSRPARPGRSPGKPSDRTCRGVADVKAVQDVLADLGYAPGPVDGALGARRRTRSVPSNMTARCAETGRITPDLLSELKRVTGRDMTKMAAER